MKISISKNIKKRKTLFFIAGIIFSILIFTLFEHLPDIPLALLIIYWIMISLIFKLRENIFFIVSLILLFFCPFFIIKNNQVIADKFAVWSLLSIIIGIFSWAMSIIISKNK